VRVEYTPIRLGDGLRRLLILPISGKMKLGNVFSGDTPEANEYGLVWYPSKRAMSINLWISPTIIYGIKGRTLETTGTPDGDVHNQFSPFLFPTARQTAFSALLDSLLNTVHL